MSTSVKTKQCPHCKVIKPLYKFGMRKNKCKLKDGSVRTYYYYQAWCSACRNLDTQTSPNHLPQFDTLPEYYGEE
jgi:hypothetical protein